MTQNLSEDHRLMISKRCCDVFASIKSILIFCTRAIAGYFVCLSITWELTTKAHHHTLKSIIERMTYMKIKFILLFGFLELWKHCFHRKILAGLWTRTMCMGPNIKNYCIFHNNIALHCATL